MIVAAIELTAHGFTMGNGLVSYVKVESAHADSTGLYVRVL